MDEDGHSGPLGGQRPGYYLDRMVYLAFSVVFGFVPVMACLLLRGFAVRADGNLLSRHRLSLWAVGHGYGCVSDVAYHETMLGHLLGGSS